MNYILSEIGQFLVLQSSTKTSKSSDTIRIYQDELETANVKIVRKQRLSIAKRPQLRKIRRDLSVADNEAHFLVRFHPYSTVYLFGGNAINSTGKTKMNWKLHFIGTSQVI